MLLDNRNRFCNSTLIPFAAGTVLIGDQIDLGPRADIGEGNAMHLVVSSPITAVGGTSANFILRTADNTAVTTNAEDVVSTGVIALASLTAGTTHLVVELPKRLYRRYLGIFATTVGTFSGAGAIDIFLVNDPQNWRAYADAAN
jgi:hypothetical protein